MRRKRKQPSPPLIKPLKPWELINQYEPILGRKLVDVVPAALAPNLDDVEPEDLRITMLEIEGTGGYRVPHGDAPSFLYIDAMRELLDHEAEIDSEHLAIMLKWIAQEYQQADWEERREVDRLREEQRKEREHALDKMMRRSGH